MSPKYLVVFAFAMTFVLNFSTSNTTLRPVAMKKPQEKSHQHDNSLLASPQVVSKRSIINNNSSGDTKNSTTSATSDASSSPVARNVLDVLKVSRRPHVERFRACLDQKIKLDGNRHQQYSNDNDLIGIHTVVDDNSDLYQAARLTWNKAQKALQYPDVVTFPSTTQHVALIVQCAVQTDYYVCARNGKHSYESDTCVHGIVVDVDHLNTFEMLNNTTGHARFGAGQHLGHVSIVLSDYKRVLPMGTCPSVGLTGLSLVGGHGMLTRHHGLLIDFVSAIELVNDQGQIIYANKTNEHADYLWMARGGGSGVMHFPGIITALEFENLPAMEESTKTYTAITFEYQANVDNAAALLTAWQSFYTDPDNLADPLFRRLTLEPWLKLDRVGPKGLQYNKVLQMAVYFYGNDDLHQQFIQKYLPRIKKFLPGRQSSVERYDLLAFARLLSGTKNNQELGDGRHGWDLYERSTSNHRMNHWKGVSTVAARPIPPESFRVVANTIFHSKPLSRRYAEFKALGGAMAEIDQDETSFWHRKALWWCLSNHFWLSTDEESRVKAIRQNAVDRNMNFVKSMKEANFGGYYAGYIHRTNSTEQDLVDYYGGHADRIASIKQNRDPKNLFRLYRPNNVQEIFDSNVAAQD